MNRPRRKYTGVPTETDLQIQVAGFLRACLLPPFFFFHVPNGGSRSFTEGARFKKMGVLAGIPDAWIVGDRRAFTIELKREKGGRVSDDQRAVHELLRLAGIPVAVCKTLEEVKAALDGWGIPLRAVKLDRVADAMRSAITDAFAFDVVTEQAAR